jgi:SNF2 family DNA or RNA helicase
MQPPPYEFETTPYRHQGFEGALKSWNEEAWGWLLEMGSGKSKILIDNACILHEADGVNGLMIVAPKGVYQNWASREIPTHMPRRILDRACIHVWRGGHTRTEQKELEKLCSGDRDSKSLHVFIVNTEAVAASNNAERWMRRFLTERCSLLGVDESSTIRNPMAKRTKKLISLGALAEYRRILTGTPVANSPLDLFAQFQFLEPGCLGHRNFFTFRARYAILEKKSFGGRDVQVVVGHRNTDKLSKIIAGMATVIRKEDCLDLPPKVYEEWSVPLTAEQQRMYKELRDYATTELEAGRFMTTTSVITQLLRMHQLVCGTATDENGDAAPVDTNRPGELMKILEGVGDQRVIVWCNYRDDVRRVCEQLDKAGISHVQYHGGTSSEERARSIYRFQGELGTAEPGWDWWEGPVCPEKDRAQVFVGTPHAGGYGITLTAASVVVYYSNSYDLEKRLQSEDRAHRIGQSRSVTYIDMVSPGTVDEKIVEALKRKEVLANLIMDGPARIRDLFS